MVRKRFRRATIKNGKICLEDRVVDVDILKLCLVRASEGHSETEIRKRKPKGANAYLVGKEKEIRGDSDCGSFYIGAEDVYPVLYLKVKKPKGE